MAKLEIMHYKRDIGIVPDKPFLDLIITADADKFEDLPESITLAEDFKIVLGDFLQNYKHTVIEFTDEYGQKKYRHFFN